MNIGGRNIDHIVYCVPNLDQALLQFHAMTGLLPNIGGRHI